jgi:D-threo-aldose 1-dehydrogenase
MFSSKVGDECPPYSNNGGHSAFSYEGVLASVDNSLRRMGLDHLDLVLLHDPLMRELQAFLSDRESSQTATTSMGTSTGTGIAGGGMQALRELKRQGVVGHIGIGCVDRPQQLLFLKEPDAEVVLSVNDWNLVRRYANDDLFPATAEAGAGVINAGCFYMGLLAAPATSFTEGFKKTLQLPQLVDLARRMEAWWAHAYNVPLRVPAVQFAARHTAVATVAVGCRSAQEVDECCDAMLHPLPEEAWRRFDEAFNAEVRAFRREWHWFYDKETADIGNK